MPRLAIYGYGRYIERVQIPFTGFLTVVAVNAMLSQVAGFKRELEKVQIVTTVVGTGAGATRLFNIRKGSATGTIIGTFTPTLANQGTLGVVTDGTVVSAGDVNKLDDADALTIEAPNAGTAFSAGGFDVLLHWRVPLQKRN